jgi:hypothetical protein
MTYSDAMHENHLPYHEEADYRYAMDRRNSWHAQPARPQAPPPQRRGSGSARVYACSHENSPSTVASDHQHDQKQEKLIQVRAGSGTAFEISPRTFDREAQTLFNSVLDGHFEVPNFGNKADAENCRRGIDNYLFWREDCVPPVQDPASRFYSRPFPTRTHLDLSSESSFTTGTAGCPSLVPYDRRSRASQPQTPLTPLDPVEFNAWLLKAGKSPSAPNTPLHEIPECIWQVSNTESQTNSSATSEVGNGSSDVGNSSLNGSLSNVSRSSQSSILGARPDKNAGILGARP